jgi:hypothetical protein
MDHLADILSNLYYYNLPVLIQNNNILSTAINFLPIFLPICAWGHPKKLAKGTGFTATC